VASTPAPLQWKERYERSELLDVACPLCNGRRFRDVAVEFGIAVARCLDCGLTYTRTPRPQPQDHYTVAEDEFSEKYEPVFRGEAAHPRDPNYEDVLDALEKVCPPRGLLDVGSHCGFFLRRARARGWRTTGVEPSPTSSGLARERFQLDVKTGFLDERFGDESYDAVTMLDVLEHVGRPQLLLREIVRVLRPGGVAVIKVPNVRYVLAKYRVLRRIPGGIADAFDAREHLVHYSASTLTRLLREEGFELESLTVPAPIQSGGSVRRAIRRSGSALSRLGSRGVASPLAPDLLAIARRSRLRGARLDDSRRRRRLARPLEGTEPALEVEQRPEPGTMVGGGGLMLSPHLV
jgi:SAM-dependent methyltransferase